MTPYERKNMIDALKQEAKITAIWAAACAVLAVATVAVGAVVLQMLFLKG